MSVLGREALLKPSALRRETVSIEGMDGDLIMRELSVAERFRARKKILDAGLDPDDGEAAVRIMLALVASSLCAEDGSDMFPDAEEWPKVVDALMQRANATVEGLMVECQRIQGIGEQSVKDEVKNSEASRNDSSSSGSPKTSGTPQVGLSVSA